MSLRPIDLQTLFMRQTELSREQAALHDGLVQKKAVEEMESAEESLKNEEKVARTAELPDGPEVIKDDPDSKQHQKQKPGKHKAGSAADTLEVEEPELPEVVKDPMLGRNIDISG